MTINAGYGTDGVPDRGYQLYIVSIAMVIAAGLFVIGRFAVRIRKSRLGWDDYTIGAALVGLLILFIAISSIGLSLTENLAVVNGYGRQAQSLTHAEISTALKWFFVAQILYKVVITLYRISFLCLYLRIFPNKTFRWICYSGIGFTACCGTAFILATIFQCTPVAFAWDKKIKPAHCIDSKAFWFSYAMINIASDVVILALPLFQIRHLQLKRREKIGVMGVFAMGAFVCVTTIVRTTTLARSAAAGDPTWAPLPATVWSVVEANTGIICACLPMLKQPLSILFPRLFQSKSTTDSDSHTCIDSYKSNENGHSRHRGSDDDFAPWAHPMVATNVSHVVGGWRNNGPTTDSEERIIEHQGRGHGIARTVGVSVTDYNDGDERPLRSPYNG